MRKNFIIIIVLMLTILQACGVHKDITEENSESMSQYKLKMNEDYITKELSLTDLNVKKAGGIVFDGEYLYISDMESAVIVIYDKALQSVKNVNIPEVTSPSLLYQTETAWYILNQQTNTVFQVSHDFSSVLKRFPLPKKDPSSHYMDLSVAKNKIYITLYTAEKMDAKIIEIDGASGEGRQLGEDFVGATDATNEHVYFINSLVAYQHNEKSGFRGGEHYLSVLNQGNITKQGELLKKSYVGDFIYTNDFLYVYAAGESSIDRYDKQLNYIDSITKFLNSDIESLLSGNVNHLFLLMKNEQKLYEVRRK